MGIEYHQIDNYSEFSTLYSQEDYSKIDIESMEVGKKYRVFHDIYAFDFLVLKIDNGFAGGIVFNEAMAMLVRLIDTQKQDIQGPRLQSMYGDWISVESILDGFTKTEGAIVQMYRPYDKNLQEPISYLDAVDGHFTIYDPQGIFIILENYESEVEMDGLFEKTKTVTEMKNLIEAMKNNYEDEEDLEKYLEKEPEHEHHCDCGCEDDDEDDDEDFDDFDDDKDDEDENCNYQLVGLLQMKEFFNTFRKVMK